MTTTDARRLRNHWWPRPGWRPGRIMLTWHLTFENAPELHEHVAAYQRALAELPGLNPVPPEWLHLTMQGVGYVDETPPETIPTVVDAVRAAVAQQPAFSLTFARPSIFGEAIAIRPSPAEPVGQLLAAIRSGMGSVLRETAVPTGPEQARGFRPHVSIAYSQTEGDAAPYDTVIAAVDAEPIDVPIEAVTLIRQERLLAPDWMYRWKTQATVTFPS